MSYTRPILRLFRCWSRTGSAPPRAAPSRCPTPSPRTGPTRP